MIVRVLPNGNLLVPVRVEGEGIIGDATAEIGPDSPDFQSWVTWMKRRDNAQDARQGPATQNESEVKA